MYIYSTLLTELGIWRDNEYNVMGLHFFAKFSPTLLDVSCSHAAHRGFGVSLQKPKDALCVFNTFSVKDLIAFPKEINRKLLLSIPFRYRYTFQQQRYRLMLCTAACIMEGGVIVLIDRVESHCIKSDQDCTTLAES